MAQSILLIEDQRIIGTLYSEELEDAGYEVHWLQDGKEAVDLLHSGKTPIDMVITDYHVPGTNGMQILHAAQELREDLPVLFITAHGSVETAIEAMKAGAFDYLEKPIDLDKLVALARQAMAQIPTRPAEPIKKAETDLPPQILIGRSELMLGVYKSIGRVAALPATVFIHGETGTGKELIAQTIHRFSKRAEKPFVAINCAAIPETLLESELFGHERGAFTGAEKLHIGRFEQADGGTIFLDEIGDMPHALQVKLLRVLQERKIQRLGGSKEIPVDVRIIAATHRDLEQLIQSGDFREDLFHRLCVAEIELPPLRERRDDIPLLVNHLLNEAAKEYGFKMASIDEEAMSLLQQQPWPGNVRQLQNAVRKALLISRNMTISVHNLHELNIHTQTVPATTEAIAQLHESEQTLASEESRLPLTQTAFSLKDWVKEALKKETPGGLREALIDRLDKELIQQTLQQCRYNRTQAAELLGITRKTLRARMTALDID
ncbi:MAG: sigma-54-dependent Fis family transcriptional regulator [Opitutales bacterium]|nr:sigma-54-dependent Fis family transcriptional regulator [Opitutales bacterium]